MRRERLLHPIPAILTWCSTCSSVRNSSNRSSDSSPNFSSRFERQLISRAFHMIDQNDQIIRMNTRLLRRAIEEKSRILDQILIQRIAARDEESSPSFPGAVRPVRTAATCWQSIPDSHSARTLAAGRYRCQAPAHSYSRRREFPRCASRVRSPGAASANIRRDSRGSTSLPSS